MHMELALSAGTCGNHCPGRGILVMHGSIEKCSSAAVYVWLVDTECMQYDKPCYILVADAAAASEGTHAFDAHGTPQRQSMHGEADMLVLTHIYALAVNVRHPKAINTAMCSGAWRAFFLRGSNAE